MEPHARPPTRTTVTETETTLADGTKKVTRVTVVEPLEGPGSAAGAAPRERPAPTSVSEVLEQTVGEAADVVERGVAVGRKIGGLLQIARVLVNGAGGAKE
jgi:hypothetical protein